MSHCALLQTDEIQAIIGDAARNGVGGTQYCGIWSLTSKHRPFNAFGNSFAGLIPGEIRSKTPVLSVTNDRACVLSRSADESYPVDVRAEYRLSEPHAIDHILSFTDRKDMRLNGCDFREVSWCSYMNCPEDPRLHFLSQGRWHHYLSPAHGVGANIAPSYIPEVQLEQWPTKSGPEKKSNDRPFQWNRYEHRFDEPFYYGRLGHMVLIKIFDTPRWLRFFCSPTGGGSSLIQGHHCPAWDFEWIIPAADYIIGREYSFRTRLIYKPFISEDDVIDEYRKAQVELGFERKPAF